ncbi:MAG: alkaline phosphatase D family protein [Candidatus Rokuibacteriota bacterium]
MALAAVARGDGGGARLLVASGEITATGAVVWVRGVREGDVTVDVSVAGGAAASRVRTRATAASDLAVKAVVRGLAPATRYVYQARQGDDRADGEFTTAPAPDDRARVTFLWSGDLGGGGFCRPREGGFRIFEAMTRRSADFFVFAGDTVYADVACKPDAVPHADARATTLPQYHARHRYNREDAAYQRFLARTPVFAIWDDHEVRNDFSGPSQALMPAGRQAFIDYWPLVPPVDEPGRLYRHLRWGGLLDVFILDTRQYRSPNADRDGPSKTMLGPAQRRWLVDAVAASSAVWKVVVSSVSLSVPTGRPARRDSWTGASVFGLPAEDATGFATERDGILKELRARAVKNLVFAVSDVHHAELIRHEPQAGFVFHEMIAGPLLAKLGRPRPLDDSLNPRSLFAYNGAFNFGEVSVDGQGLTVRFVDVDGAVLFTHLVAAE